MPMFRVQFVLFWTLAQTWPIAVATLWPIVHVGDNYWETDVQVKLAQFSMTLAALTQWPLLLRRVRYAWLWPAAGLAISLLSLFIDDVLRHTDYGLGLLKAGPLASFGFLFVGGALAVGVCQAIVVALWRKGGWSWLPLSAVVWLLASVAGLYAAAYFGPWFLASLDNWTYLLATRIIDYVSAAVIFGGLSGYLMARRLIVLSDGVTVPA